MSPELEKRIEDWKRKSSDKKGKRSFTIKPHRVHMDEYAISLKIELWVTNGIQTEKVTVKSNMMTQNGGSDKDLARLDETIAKLETDFRFRGGQAFARMEKMVRGDGDVERNPYS